MYGLDRQLCNVCNSNVECAESYAANDYKADSTNDN